MNAGLSVTGAHGRIVGGIDVSTTAQDPRVRVAIFTGSDVAATASSSIRLSPDKAREIAGAILAAADEVTGEDVAA